MALCLIVEDDPREGNQLRLTLGSEGHEAMIADDGQSAMAMATQFKPELVLLDLGLPDVQGMSLIPEILKLSPLTRIIVLSGADCVRTVVAALRAGARHYLLKPWDRDELLLIVDREARAVNLAETTTRDGASFCFWGAYPSMVALKAYLERLASSPLTPVLIQGETGSGKEVLARELHRLTRPGGAFVAVNCAAIPSELLESELFGHERGAFTGADSRRRGVVELARDGTLFLDEVAELPPNLQSKLLRFLETRSFKRLGDEQELNVACRIVAATHQDLSMRQADGRFRQDLYYRLAVVCLTIPPLRLRRADLLSLAHLIVTQIANAIGKAPKPLSPRAEEIITNYEWPGNIRELKNRLERAMVLSANQQIQPEDLDLADTSSSGPTMDQDSDGPEQILNNLREYGWNISKAARKMGVPRHWLRYRISKLAIERPAGLRRN